MNHNIKLLQNLIGCGNNTDKNNFLNYIDKSVKETLSNKDDKSNNFLNYIDKSVKETNPIKK